MSADLAVQSCVPCRGGIPPMERADAERLIAEVPGWSLMDDGRRIERRYRFRNFADALGFVDAVGALAEAEGHHPDLHFGWGYAVVSLHTHKIKGLHANDFILAAKVDRLPQAATEAS